MVPGSGPPSNVEFPLPPWVSLGAATALSIGDVEPTSAKNATAARMRKSWWASIRILIAAGKGFQIGWVVS